MSANRYVIFGPPGCGKSTWVRLHAIPGDLVWDLDSIASVLAYKGQEIPREERGRLPWAVVKATLVMREALVSWLAQTPTYSACVFIIATRPEDAREIAGRIGAELVDATLTLERR